MEKITQEQQLHLDDISIKSLDETRKWTKFIAIVGFVVLGLIVIAGFSVAGMSRRFSPNFPLPGIWLSITYIILAIVYFFPLYYLLRFSNQMKKSIKDNDHISLTSAFVNLRKHYRFIGILTILMILFYLVFFIVSMFAGVAGLNY
ncbi:MAG: DUF5362 family protein [Bacteroidota bacterium]